MINKTNYDSLLVSVFEPSDNLAKPLAIKDENTSYFWSSTSTLMSLVLMPGISTIIT